MTTKHVCSYQDHADLIATLRAEGKYGERLCNHCGRTTQVGPERCPHSCLIVKGKTLCESCKTGPGDSKVSQVQVDAFLRDVPAIADTDLSTAPEVTEETEIDTALLSAEI